MNVAARAERSWGIVATDVVEALAPVLAARVGTSPTRGEHH